MPVIASFFDTDSAATNALDELLNKSEYKDTQTQVISSRSNLADQSMSAFVPGPQAQSPVGLPTNDISPVPVTGNMAPTSLFNDLPSEERGFFEQALKKGGVLALAKVDDDHAGEVRRTFSMHGGRTYEKK